MSSSNNGPIMKFRAGGMEIAVWESRNGRGYHASIRNQYFKKDTKEWVETKNWYLSDIRNLLEQCKSAVAYMHEKEGNRQVEGRPIAEDYSAKKPEKQPTPKPYVEAGMDTPDTPITFDNDDIPF